MQAITTRWMGTDFKVGGKGLIKVRCQAHEPHGVIVEWDDALSIEQNHDAAATQVASALGWLEHNTMHGGAMPDGSGRCYVLIPIVKGY